MTDCPNCGAQVDGDALLCGECGFDVRTSVADDVRRLRREGRITPGRLNPRETSVAPADVRRAQGERPGGAGAEHYDAGL